MQSQSIQAIQNNFYAIDQSASRMARFPEDPTVDLAKERIEQLNIQRSTEAQVEVLRTQDEMLGLILDLKA